MALDKLRPELTPNLIANGVTELNELQTKCISKVKEGKNLLIVAPKGSGKSMLCNITTIQKVTQPEEGSPRALMICLNDDEAKENHAWQAKFARRMDLTIDMIHEKGKILIQRNEIFDGTEIIVGTPKRIGELYLQNGINIQLLKLLIIDDASEMMRREYQAQLLRIIENLPKCQIMICTEHHTEKLKIFMEKLQLNFTLVKQA
jgi:superfamily II DNA/RNA helicase